MKKILLFTTVITLLTNITLAYPVMYNTKTGKYHKLGCKWAQKCTVNCVKIDHKEAKNYGGVPCKVCGG